MLHPVINLSFLLVCPFQKRVSKGSGEYSSSSVILSQQNMKKSVKVLATIASAAFMIGCGGGSVPVDETPPNTDELADPPSEDGEDADSDDGSGPIN
tara:strand:- start:104 stop:394 length:291 start_codon:yes stop_codon:yes gene_type:complete